MYGKFFKRCFEGSMVGAGEHVFAVWAYAISHAVKARVELNPELLWRVIGSTKEKMVLAIEYLCQPDPESTHDEHGGRRLLKEGPYQYFMPQFERYQKIRNNDELREQNRIRQAKHREKLKAQAAQRDPANIIMPQPQAAALLHQIAGGVEQSGASPAPST